MDELYGEGTIKDKLIYILSNCDDLEEILKDMDWKYYITSKKKQDMGFKCVEKIKELVNEILEETKRNEINN